MTTWCCCCCFVELELELELFVEDAGEWSDEASGAQAMSTSLSSSLILDTLVNNSELFAWTAGKLSDRRNFSIEQLIGEGCCCC